jgi:PAS domain S-box-containing protein
MEEQETTADMLATVGRMLAKLVRSSALERGDVKLALGELTETASTALGVERASVWRFSEDRSRLDCLDLYERPIQDHSSGQISSVHAAPAYFKALDSERTIAASDARTDPRTNEFTSTYLAPNKIGATLDAPIWVSGRLVGVICHEHVGGPRVWQPWEELVAGTFADCASMILGASERVRQAKALADYGSKLEQLVDERTKRLRAERRLLETVFATAPYGMAFFDREGRYVRINDWLARLNGVSAEDTIGKRPSEVIRDPAGGLACDQMIAQVLETGRPAQPFEMSSDIVVPHPTFLVSAYPIADDEDVARVGCFVVEITAQRMSEVERAQLLERERAAREEAEAANRAKDEFLAMLGHELRNPLSPIQTALYLMERLEDVAFDERAVIARQVGHLSRLVDDVLDVARITRGKIELRVDPVEMSDAVAKGIELASPALERRGHFLEVDVPDVGLEVHGDCDRLAQVVSNLLNNAAKFTPKGGRIQIRGSRVAGHAVLTVRDNGAGIPKELLPKLFDAFVQGERQLDRSQGGLGLGLAIVRGIVVAHGGEVTAASEGNGTGAEFTIRIPLLVENPAAFHSDDGDYAIPQRGGRRRILVVDDNVDAAHMLARALEQFGHETTTAFDGPTAVALASEFRPQLALLDLGLPVMDGFELASKLKELPGLSAIKLVAVTGYGRPGDLERTKQAGFAEHMVKPIEVFKLEYVLETLFAPQEQSA